VEGRLAESQVRDLISSAVESFPLEQCDTCECFLGYVAQLEMDSDASSRQYLRGFAKDRVEIHSCLGCDPCPPSDHFARYLQDGACETCAGGA
jgi:hypothetical protein